MGLIDLPEDFKLKHILSYTLPGFFSALTLFMLLGYWSPQSTSIIINYIGGNVNFVGLFFLIGTILGVIMSGIHHSIIEDLFFDKLPEIERLQDIRIECFQRIDGGFAFDKDPMDIKKLKLTRHYSFKIFGDQRDLLNSIIVDDYYSYSEFYSNTFLSLLSFSFIVPYYLLASLNVPWLWSVIFGFASSILAIFCLISGYSNYRAYLEVVNSIMFGYVSDKKQKES